MTEATAKLIIEQWYISRLTAREISRLPNIRCTEDGVHKVINKELFPHLHQPKHIPHFRSGKRFPVKF